MVNFTLPAVLEVDQNEEDPNEEDSDDDDRHLNIIERKVKKWTISKIQQLEEKIVQGICP
jgi:hypothetical protein